MRLTESFEGVPVMTSMSLVNSVWKKRSWRERLFRRPWRPWVKLRLVQEPDPMIYLMSSGARPAFLAHPATWESFKRALPKEEQHVGPAQH